MSIKATASIATPKTDAKLKEQMFQAGADAKANGYSESACPYRDGLPRAWWLEGYHHR